MSDERLEQLGKTFVHFKHNMRYGITFEQFIRLVDSGEWKERFQDRKLKDLIYFDYCDPV
jgi:hypothetical protein